jgi:hypothetical protein
MADSESATVWSPQSPANAYFSHDLERFGVTASALVDDADPVSARIVSHGPTLHDKDNRSSKSCRVPFGTR